MANSLGFTGALTSLSFHPKFQIQPALVGPASPASPQSQQPAKDSVEISPEASESTPATGSGQLQHGDYEKHNDNYLKIFDSANAQDAQKAYDNFLGSVPEHLREGYQQAYEGSQKPWEMFGPSGAGATNPTQSGQNGSAEQSYPSELRDSIDKLDPAGASASEPSSRQLQPGDYEKHNDAYRQIFDSANAQEGQQAYKDFIDGVPEHLRSGYEQAYEDSQKPWEMFGDQVGRSQARDTVAQPAASGGSANPASDTPVEGTAQDESKIDPEGEYQEFQFETYSEGSANAAGNTRSISGGGTFQDGPQIDPILAGPETDKNDTTSGTQQPTVEGTVEPMPQQQRPEPRPIPEPRMALA